MFYAQCNELSPLFKHPDNDIFMERERKQESKDDPQTGASQLGVGQGPRILAWEQ